MAQRHCRCQVLDPELQKSLAPLDPQPALDGLYDPAEDTLLVPGLKADFDELALNDWFDGWADDGLLFLGSVGRPEANRAGV